MNEPKLLSECGERLVIDEKDHYDIKIEAGDYLVVKVGYTANKSGASFYHPNIARTAKTIHEFKHYRRAGSKFWTSRAGIDHYLVIPRNKIALLPEKGYSYIPAIINGVKVTFNVSGGSSGKGWTDYLSTNVSIMVNHKLSDLKKLAEVSVRNSPFEPVVVKKLEAREEAQWYELQAKSTSNYKNKIAKMIEDGIRPVIQLMNGYNTSKGIGSQLIRRLKRIPIPNEPNSYTFDEIGAPKRVIIEDETGYKTSVKINQINWYETAKANGII